MATTGTWNIGGYNLPDLGFTEALAGRIRALNQPAFVNQQIPWAPSTPSAYSGQTLGATTQPTGGQSSANYSPASSADLNRTPSPQTNTQGGGGGGTSQLDTLRAIQAAGQLNPAQTTQLAELEARARQQSQGGIDAISQAIEAQKQGLRNKIPYIQQQRDLNLQGLQQGLDQFTSTADQELAKRLAGFKQQEGQVNEDYTQSARSTRQAAQALSRQIRNQFAGLGTLDSTAYRDANIEASRGIAQSLGDITREKAGKLSTIGTEKGDTEQYYAQQKLGEIQRVELEKQKVIGQTDQLVQSVLDDINQTDASKVQAIQDAEARLASRLDELDKYKLSLASEADKNSQDIALKIAQLQGKQNSSGYDTVLNNRKAIEGAAAVVQDFSAKYNQPMTVEQATQVFSQYGLDKETATYYGQLYGGKNLYRKDGGSTSNNDSGSNNVAGFEPR